MGNVAVNQKEIDEVLERLRRGAIGRDAIALLASKLIELRHPEIRVEFVSDSEIRFGEGGSLHLHNLWVQCEKEPENRAEIVDRYVRILAPSVEERMNDIILREAVIPLVRDAVYRTCVKEEDWDLITRHIVGDLWIVFALDLPESMIVLSANQLSELAMDADELLQRAIQNVEQKLGQLEFSPYAEFYTFTCADALYASSTLLLDYVWDQAAELLGDDVVVAVPARDTVIFTGAKNKEGLRQVREQATYVVTNGHHTITDTLFRRVGGEWKLFL